MTEPSDLEPAEHVKPAPADGWRGADLTDDELVDDEFIAADPDSFILADEDAV
jgi:hypothetical protein